MGTGFLGRNSKSCDELALSSPAGIVSSSACMEVQEAVNIVFGQGRDGCSSCTVVILARIYCRRRLSNLISCQAYAPCALFRVVSPVSETKPCCAPETAGSWC